ncbi:MAG TPA: RNA-directed DNA polymerase [Candidatus Saccharimonadales bacterium]|jgi:hypothetical protein|nr:RNA-directed DNA polymerase [Candidatus Saccharimonadales bacterium]
MIRQTGLPIGNLTSQIFANTYLNELDQFVLHSVKPLGYVRYGNDFVLWCESEAEAHIAKVVTTQFLLEELYLKINPMHDRVQPVSNKLPYLGVELWPSGRRLSPEMVTRIGQKLDYSNSSSYYALTKHHQPARYLKRFKYDLLDILT